MKKLFFLLVLSILILISGCKKSPTNESPKCTIISPKDGSELSVTDDIIVSIEAKDSDGSITVVNVYFDNVQYGAVLTEPYTVTIPSEILSQGKHTIKAIAIDNESAQTEASVTVNIGDGGSDTESPNFITFTNGVIPVSWKTSTWAVDVAMGYDDNYSLRSDNPIASVVTNKTMNSLAYLEFYTRGDNFDLFIDNKKVQALSSSTVDNWKKWVYTFDKGSHSLRWEVSGTVVYLDAIKFGNAELPKVTTTTNVANVTATSATSGGNVSQNGNNQVTTRGVCWNTSPNPTINDKKTTDGSGTGSFTSNITGLLSGTTYYVRAYATNGVGTAYGEQVTFTTISANLPTVFTGNISNITSMTAACEGSVTDDGNSTVTARGICWNTSQNPTIKDKKTVDGSGLGDYTGNLKNLERGTLYYVRAYATNSEGTAYGEQKSFTTNSTFQIGEEYQGGIIAYVDNTGNHGFIVSKTSANSTGYWAPTDGEGGATGATETSVGSGKRNTDKIVNTHGTGENYAAYSCVKLNSGGYKDWFLPSLDELKILQQNKDFIEGLIVYPNSEYYYWSSTEKNAYYAYAVEMISGKSVERLKTYLGHRCNVRAIRYF